jgi:hypothetical protein
VTESSMVEYTWFLVDLGGIHVFWHVAAPSDSLMKYSRHVQDPMGCELFAVYGRLSHTLARCTAD